MLISPWHELILKFLIIWEAISTLEKVFIRYAHTGLKVSGNLNSFRCVDIVWPDSVTSNLAPCSVGCLWHSHGKNPVRLYPKLQSQPIGLRKIFIDYLFFEADQSYCIKSVSIFNRFASSEERWNQNVPCQIDLVTVFDAILTSRQTCEKLQCLYENLMSHNFRKTAVLKKISIVN